MEKETEPTHKKCTTHHRNRNSHLKTPGKSKSHRTTSRSLEMAKKLAKNDFHVFQPFQPKTLSRKRVRRTFPLMVVNFRPKNPGLENVRKIRKMSKYRFKPLYRQKRQSFHTSRLPHSLRKENTPLAKMEKK